MKVLTFVVALSTFGTLRTTPIVGWLYVSSVAYYVVAVAPPEIDVFPLIIAVVVNDFLSESM